MTCKILSPTTRFSCTPGVLSTKLNGELVLIKEAQLTVRNFEFNPLNDNKDLSNYNYNEIHYKNENLQLLVKEKNRLDKYIAKRNYES